MEHWLKSDTAHLCNSVGANFSCTVDKEGSNYCGFTLSWDYKIEFVDISMSKYVPKALKRLNSEPKVTPQHSPHEHAPVIYEK